MNHVYRLIWNTSLGCWMVASEHTRSHGKRSSTARGLVAAVVLALSVPAAAADVLIASTEEAVETLDEADDRTINSASLAVHKERIAPFGEALPRGNATSALPLPANRALQAEVNDPSFAWATLKGENSLVLGSRASVTGNRSTGIGNEVLTNGSGHTAVGSKATATGGKDAVAIGINAMTNGTGHVAIGEAARADTNGVGDHAVAIGARARAGSQGWTGATAVGGEAFATYNGIALGYKALAQNNGAMALGYWATADDAYTSAIGYQAIARGTSSIAMGNEARATSANGIALGRSAQVTGLSAIALGQLSKAGHDSAIALGTQAEATGSQSLAIGLRSKATGQTAMALGMDAEAVGNYATALGHQAKAASHYANAIGFESVASGGSSVAIGSLANSAAAASVAIGDRAKVDATAASSVALGKDSVATVASTVSVGSATLKRKIVNVGDGEVSASSTDAVTGKQLHAVTNRLNGQTVALGENTRLTGGRAVSIGANSQVDTGGGNDGIAIGGNARAGTPGYGGPVAIGGGAKADYDGLALGYAAHASAGEAVALGRGSIANVAKTVSVGSDTLKRKIVNVADGAVSATSSETVTGKQLFATNQNVTAAKSAADAAKIEATAALTKATLVSGLVGQASATGNVRLGAENTGTALDVRNKANVNRVVGGVADGVLSVGSTEAVTGKQLFATNHNVTTATNTANAAKLEATAALTKSNLVSGLVGQASATGNVRLGAENTGTALDVRNKANANRVVSGVADGALSTGSTEAVTGKQLFATNQNVTTATNTANSAKTAAEVAQGNALDALGKANHLNGLVSQAAVNGAVRLGGANTGSVVDVRNSNGGTRTLSGVAAGAMHAGSNEAVNGAQLSAINERVELHSVAIAVNRLEIGVNRDGLDELRKAFDGFEPDLTGVVKYNADGSLVDLDGAKVAGVTAGEVSASSRDAINGSQLFGTNERVGYLEEQQRYVMVGALDASLPAKAGILGVAVGGDAEARQEGATAVGSYASALGRNSVALGRGSYVAPDARNGFALGTRTNVESEGGMAIGADSDVMLGADQSVALGSAFVAKEADTVSVGSGDYRRRIVSVARGTKDDNVTTLVQLREAVTALGGGAAIDAAGQVVAPKYTLSEGEFNNVGAALTSIDTKLVSHQDELDTLDTRYKALVQSDRSIRYNDDRSVVDFGGARVTGIADGSLSSNSSDAVNGAQLFATNQRVGGLEDKQRFVMVGANGSNGSAHAEGFGVAVGGDAAAGADGATAVGSFATALGTNSVALGRGSYVASDGRDGFALGSRTRVQSVGGLAIGSDADVMSGAYQSVALGTASVANEAHTVSVGSGEYRRRIVSVAQGIKSDDATTVSQLRGALAALGGGADLDARGNVIGPRFAVQGSEYGSFGDAISALDGSIGDNKRNLDTLDSRFQRLFQESPSVNADAPGRLSLGGAQGMVLGNVANGLIGQGSRDAVNGGQLWAVKQDLQGQIDALDPGKSDASATPLALNARSGSITPSADGGGNLTPPDATPPAADPGKVAAQDPLVKAEGDNAVAVGSEGKERAVKHVAEGRADTDAANVRQVNDALERANAYTDSAVASVNQRLDQVDKRINRMAAISSAQSAMAMNTAGLATANRLGAGVGYSEGESAMAVGYQRVLTERGSATFSLNGAFTNSGEKSVGVGVGIGW